MMRCIKCGQFVLVSVHGMGKNKQSYRVFKYSCSNPDCDYREEKEYPYNPGMYSSIWLENYPPGWSNRDKYEEWLKENK